MEIKSLSRAESTKQVPVMKKKRIDYVDYLKAITIFGVVWIHSVSCPHWLTTMLVDVIFFFLSGIFFRRKPFKEFLIKKVNRILVPFFIFYFLYYPYRMIWHYWDHRTLMTFEWRRIIHFFIGGDITTLPALWFLFSLFLIYIAYYFLSYLDKKIILIGSILILLYIKPLFLLHWPYLTSTSICCLSYFALGNILGKPLLSFLTVNAHKLEVIIVGSVLYAILFYLQDGTLTDQFRLLIDQLQAIIVCVCMLALLSYFNGYPILDFLLYWGKNTLAMLCIHVSILRFCTRLANKLLDSPSPLIGFISTIITFGIAYFIINFINKKLPYLVGEKDIIRF